MTVTVRTMTAGDTPARARLWRESGRYLAALDPDTAREPDSEGLEAWIAGIHERWADDPSVLMLVAEKDGEVVGALTARLLEPLPSARWQSQRDLGRRRVHVDALTVAESARRAGVATALMAAAEAWATDRQAAVLILETGLRNLASVPFYELRMGYTRHEVVFRKTLRRTT